MRYLGDAGDDSRAACSSLATSLRFSIRCEAAQMCLSESCENNMAVVQPTNVALRCRTGGVQLLYARQVRERERERETDRHRQTDRQTDRQRDRQRERARASQREREREREREGEREIHSRTRVYM